MQELNRENPSKEPPRRALSDFYIEIVGLICVFMGLILSFFYLHLASALVGLGFGLGFYKEILNYFLLRKEYYTAHGIVKTLIFIGIILFFLVALPAFIIAAAIGFGIMTLISRSLRP